MEVKGTVQPLSPWNKQSLPVSTEDQMNKTDQKAQFWPTTRNKISCSNQASGEIPEWNGRKIMYEWMISIAAIAMFD